jgi:hypothetical protein
VAQQFTAALGQDVCSAPPAAMTFCSGESAAPKSIPHSGAAAGSSCTDSSQCAETRCGCANGCSYYAASCVNGRCDNSAACACVAQQFNATFGQDVCSACPPPPLPPAAPTCDGASSAHQSSPRSGALPGDACTDSSQCTQALCQCSNGNTYYAASCVNGICDNTGACACVGQQFSAAFGLDICN